MESNSVSGIEISVTFAEPESDGALNVSYRGFNKPGFFKTDQSIFNIPTGLETKNRFIIPLEESAQLTNPNAGNK